MEATCECRQVNEAEWQRTKHTWERRTFYRTSHGLLFHIPIGIAGAISKGMAGIKAKGYTLGEPFLMPTGERGLFSADMPIAIQETPENDPNVVTWDRATLYSSYYHGPFRDMKRQADDLVSFVEKGEKRKPGKIYTWVTNCPRCWKRQGGPTTVILAAM